MSKPHPRGTTNGRAKAVRRWWRNHPKDRTPRDRPATGLLGAWRVVDTALATHALTDTVPPLVACTQQRLVGDTHLAILRPGEDPWPVSTDCADCVRAAAPTC